MTKILTVLLFSIIFFNEILKKIFFYKDPDVNKRLTQNLPLYTAVDNNSIDIVKYLLRRQEIKPRIKYVFFLIIIFYDISNFFLTNYVF